VLTSAIGGLVARGQLIGAVTGAVFLIGATSFASDRTEGIGPTEGIAVVAIDPGHGGTNLGAAAPARGVYEKNIMLALAERIRTLVVEAHDGAPALKVVLCREVDVLVPIRARARCARDSGARLFLSLHANAVPAGLPGGSQRGFEVYVLGPREVEDDAALAQLSEPDDVSAVWAAHEVRDAAERSIRLGKTIDDQLTRALGVEARRGLKQTGAALDVLRGTGTAAALVEVGFLDHPIEGARLSAAEGREPIAQALAASIRAYVRAEARPASPARIPGNPQQSRAISPAVSAVGHESTMRAR
jgi:N-acetylmuramoyl-L-alanine amidase